MRRKNSNNNNNNDDTLTEMSVCRKPRYKFNLCNQINNPYSKVNAKLGKKNKLGASL